MAIELESNEAPDYSYVAENIKRLRKKSGLSQVEFGAIADVSSMAVSQWENARAVPRMGATQALADHFKIKKSEIIDEAEEKYFASLPDGAIIPIASELAYLPLIGGVHATDFDDETEAGEMIELPASVKMRHPNAFFLCVEGDCMDKVYPEGCYVLVDKDRQPQNGSIACFEDENYKAVMRKYLKGSDTLVLSPDSFNTDHKDIVIQADTEKVIKIIGTVVWFQASKEMD